MIGEIDAELVHRLVVTQFPKWSDKPIARIETAGVDNLMFQLGNDLLVRLPRGLSSVEPLAKEQAWLPRLGPLLPLATPSLEGVGLPSDDFPWPWSVMRWIEGVPADRAQAINWDRITVDLAEFVLSLWRMSVLGGPAPGSHNFWRGVEIRARDRLTRDAIAQLGDALDGALALAAWEADSLSGRCPVPSRWIHGDLHGQNLLLQRERLHAVIDFGCCGVGDPACDLAVAWRFLPAHVRPAFRQAVAIDQDTWQRGRAWALSISLRELCTYRGVAPRLQAISERTVMEVLREHAFVGKMP